MSKMNVSQLNSKFTHLFWIAILTLSPIQDINAGPANKTIGIDMHKECNEEYNKMQRQIDAAKKSTDCDAVFNLYKENLRKCYKETVGEMEIPFPQSSFEVASCYGENDAPEKIKQIFEYSLEYPDWTLQGPVECSGKNMWAEVLETISLFDKNPPRCASKEDLLKRLNDFKQTRNIAPLREIRGEEFGILEPKEGCPYPFEKFAKELEAKIANSNLTITPVQFKNSENDSNYYVAVSGFKQKPDAVLVLFFWSDHNGDGKEEKDGNDGINAINGNDGDYDDDGQDNDAGQKRYIGRSGTNGKDGAYRNPASNKNGKDDKESRERRERNNDGGDKKSRSDINGSNGRQDRKDDRKDDGKQDSTEDRKEGDAKKGPPCYYLINHLYFNSKQDMMEEGFQPQEGG